ncbi:MATE family efflux transporter [Allopontixanthobacter sp.]|uniref:MATE family efflux transporter n=1 Tax=Allopontixanthobacter sp. TaxID=2906452 RepID=UPI002AB9F270|nr:MATE family efflux transporter [Allopontixanthobacter sp.]MDZ4306498.1 MATE family efflux transporter [Allopontixanthobacter sp.]
MSEAAKLTRGTIRGHLVTQTLPMIFAVAAIMSIGLVDSYFIGQLGSRELAAISFIFPITMAISSLGVGISVGINSVIARSLGEGDVPRAGRRANFGLLFACAMGIAFFLALLALVEPLFRLMQAPAELMPLIQAYMIPFAAGLPLLMGIMGINGILRGQGEAKRTSVISITYAAINWVLDPILITGAFGIEGFGIAGAAYASIIGYGIAFALGIYLLRKTPLPLNPRMLKDADLGASFKAILSVAGPASFANAINPIGLSVLTALIASQGQAAVAGFGAAGRLQSFAVVPLLALSSSIGAIVGQNWGAGKPERSQRAMLWAGVFALAYGLALAVVLFAAGEWFADFFTEDPAVIAAFASYLSIAAWGYAGFGVLIISNGALNGVGRAGTALLQSFARVFLVMLPFAWLLRPDWGAEAIFAAELAANVIGGAVAGFVVWRVLRAGNPGRTHSAAV